MCLLASSSTEANGKAVLLLQVDGPASVQMMRSEPQEVNLPLQWTIFNSSIFIIIIIVIIILNTFLKFFICLLLGETLAQLHRNVQDNWNNKTT